ncbi:MAG TPA: DUF6701 domain-containing protein [Burkholderiaceae bacterium]|nr:DUF6701 domain-containing protein [Burkholderiaceae bacterium]
MNQESIERHCLYDDIQFIIDGRNTMKSGSALFLLFRVRWIGLVLMAVAFFPCTMAQAGPFEPAQCAAPRYGDDLNCTANDVLINTVTVAGDSPTSCVGGQTFPLDLDVTIHFGSPTRYDIGVFISGDGKDPMRLPARGGSAACSVAVLPNTSPFLNLDGGNCGDGDSSINGGSGNGTFRIYNVAVPCTTDGSGNTTLSIPYLVSWYSSSNNGQCRDNTYPKPDTKSKCNTGTISFPAGRNIVVLPAISLTDDVTTVRSGDTLTYKAVISNTTGFSLSGAIFTSPAVANLSISSISCTAANGAVCPTNPTVSSMQGTGIALPAMPKDGNLTFTIIGTYTGQPTNPATLTNTVSVSLSGRTNSASDTDTVMVPPLVAKSFSPNVIAIGGTSTLTITLTNPTTTVDITGAGFADNYPPNMKNTGTPSLANSCGGTPTAAANGTSLSLSGATIPRGGSCTVSVQVTATTTGINSTGAVLSSNAAGGTAATAMLAIPGAAPGSFNAFESGTVAGAITGFIKTKISGSPFSLDVVALNGGAQANAFTNAVKVELLGNTTTGIGLDGNNCPATYTLLQTISPSPVITNGRSTVNFAAVGDAWKDVRVRISYPASSPTVTSCSTDNFAIRPGAFNVSVSDQDWQTAGTARTLDNTSATGGNVHKAGQPFTISATAANSVGVTTPNYNGTPSASAITCLLPAAPSFCTQGTLNPGTWSSSSGITTSTTATYSEAGAFTMNLVDTSFADVDSADSSPEERYIRSASVNLGRFVPDHFDLGLTSLENRSDLSCGGTPFTYMDEPLKGRFTLTARNAGGATTKNYTGQLAKLDLAVPPNFNLGALDGVSRTDRLMLATSGGAWAAGVASDVILGFQFKRATTGPDGPFAPKFGIAPVDGDGVTLLASAYDLDIDPPAGNDHKQIGQSAIRFGRLKLSNAFGSEKLDLPVPLEAQYWNGVAFVTNVDDSCSPLAKANVVIGNYAGNLNSTNLGQNQLAGVGTLVAGKGSLKLSKPGAAGSADLAIKLAGTSAGGDQSCPSKVANPTQPTGAGLAYLQSRWCGADFTRDPRAHVHFGVYKNANQMIYLREMY